MRTSLAIASCAVILAAISFQTLAVAGNLVVNGGFETYPPMFDGWSVGFGGTGGLFLDNLFPHSGANAAAFNATRGTYSSLEESLPTTPGKIYEVSFWLANPYSADPQDNNFDVSWDGIGLVSLVNVPQSPYTEYKFTVPALGIATALQFIGRDQPGALYLDDVNVVEIPEPSSLILAALGLVGLALWAWRRRCA